MKAVLYFAGDYSIINIIALIENNIVCIHFLIAVCPAGQYAEDVTNVCRKCPRGYYQQASGQRMCQSCPSGQMTLHEGATSVDQCTCKELINADISQIFLFLPYFHGCNDLVT